MTSRYGSEAVIRFDGVSVRYGETIALHQTDLELRRGRTTVLVGESGSGKSTLVRAIVGLVRPSEGRVFVDDRSVATLDPIEHRRRLGYVIQEGGLFPHLTARENVTLVAEHVGWSRDRTATRLGSLAEMLQLTSAQLERRPADLSGGQRQRVSLARALFLDPDILLLDEPLGALDAATRVALQDELASLFATDRRTVVLVTHDLSEAVFLGDELVVASQGMVVRQGRPAAVLEEPGHPDVEALVTAWRRGASRISEAGT